MNKDKLPNLYALIGRKFNELDKNQKAFIKDFIDNPGKNNINVNLVGEEDVVEVRLISYDETFSNEQYIELLQSIADQPMHCKTS